MYKPISKSLYDALMLECKCEILDAKARVQIYFENPVAIGEHPQHTEEMKKLLNKLGSAEERKSVLERHFLSIYGDDKNEPKKR